MLVARHSHSGGFLPPITECLQPHLRSYMTICFQLATDVPGQRAIVPIGTNFFCNPRQADAQKRAACAQRNDVVRDARYRADVERIVAEPTHLQGDER
ncbi:hypothetical protein Poly41_22800 [Novipirellula artificiosorum]|uniref:Uncharacterized protein n=1 Tax=Novipirellula artificiosorum TaxID=2528016 RepID=A0A5C6DWK9_9BACT|nr:hypothetical protein Poly41_22800 [Novipirellula artificiosorum]